MKDRQDLLLTSVTHCDPIEKRKGQLATGASDYHERVVEDFPVTWQRLSMMKTY